MSTLATISEQDGNTINRRGCPRAPLKWVVLVYFGENNWGKLLNMNESGMCFEFAEEPSLNQRITFTFDAMGCMPAQFGGEVISESFRAAGEIKWTREFERTAGAQFAELAEESREQIRRWLSFEASGGAAIPGEDAKRETPDTHPELPEPERSSHEEAFEKVDQDASGPEVEKSEPHVEPLGTLEPELVSKILEAPGFDDYSKLMAGEIQKRESTSDLKSLWMVRAGLIAVPGCLAILAVAAGVRMIVPAKTGRSEAAGRIASLSVKESAPGTARYGQPYANRQPFLVEVQDAENHRWLLWFVNKSGQTGDGPVADKSTLTSASALLARVAEETRKPAFAKPQAARKFTLVAPKVSQHRTNSLAANSLSNAAPVVSGEPPSLAAIGGILAKESMPVPVGQAPRVGGQVQPARLIKSVPPVYPSLAKTNRLNGDVLLDALVDEAGKVTDVSVVSGPTLLRGAAMEAVRSWKYEPAQLDGRPVSMHLTVTVKFHIQ
jgi:TonB family protein